MLTNYAPRKDVRRGATDVRAGSSANGLSESESGPTTSGSVRDSTGRGTERMEAKKKPAKNDKTERNINDFAVGDHVKVNMHRGRIVDGTVKAVVNRTDGPRLQVDFGNDETALIHFQQIVTSDA